MMAVPVIGQVQNHGVVEHRPVAFADGIEFRREDSTRLVIADGSDE